MRSKGMFLVKPVIIGIGLCSLAAYSGTPAQAQTAQEQKTVQEQAEKNLGLGKGLGRQLMTEEEWRERRRKMRSMSATEREQYRKEVHQLMMERAKERGITVPETPGPRGPMKGPGTGGGRGRGGY